MSIQHSKNQEMHDLACRCRNVVEPYHKVQ